MMPNVSALGGLSIWSTLPKLAGRLVCLVLSSSWSFNDLTWQLQCNLCEINQVLTVTICLSMSKIWLSTCCLYVSKLVLQALPVPKDQHDYSIIRPTGSIFLKQEVASGNPRFTYKYVLWWKNHLSIRVWMEKSIHSPINVRLRKNQLYVVIIIAMFAREKVWFLQTYGWWDTPKLYLISKVLADFRAT